MRLKGCRESIQRRYETVRKEEILKRRQFVLDFAKQGKTSMEIARLYNKEFGTHYLEKEMIRQHIRCEG